jgi:Transcriptional regulators
MTREEQLTAGLRDLYHKIAWLNGLKMKDCFDGYKSSEIHCVEFIGKNADSNVTKLAEAFYMTMGAVSKLTKKLIAKGLIVSYRKPENKKELYFKLTDAGESIYRTHENLHCEFANRDKCVFDETTAEEIAVMVNFTEKYSSHLDDEIKKLTTAAKEEQSE